MAPFGASLDSDIFVVAAEGARLARVRGVDLLFLPGRESLFGVEDFVADLWPGLRGGLSVAQFSAAAGRAGRDGARTLRDLLAAGAVEYIAAKGGPKAVTSRYCIDLGPLGVSLNFAGSADVRPLRDMLAHLERPHQSPDGHVLIVGTPHWAGLALNGRKVDWSPWAEAGPALKILLTDLALKHLGGVALHVATLSDGDEALLLAGPPGAGKSTLAVALGTAGFRLDGDDVAALADNGRVRALPFPATVKSGAWRTLAPYRSDLARRADHTRPDGQRVRYLGLDPGAPPARRVRTVLCLDRTDTLAPAISPLGVEEAVAALLADAWSAEKTLSPRDFDALMACVAGAEFYRLTYGTLGEALSLIGSVWRGPALVREAVAP